jgi:hypothetical protein
LSAIRKQWGNISGIRKGCAEASRIHQAGVLKSLAGYGMEFVIIGNSDIHLASLDNIRKMKLDIRYPIDLADVALIDEFNDLSK